MGALRFCAKTLKPQAETGVNAYACRLSARNRLNATSTHNEKLLCKMHLKDMAQVGPNAIPFGAVLAFVWYREGRCPIP